MDDARASSQNKVVRLFIRPQASPTNRGNTVTAVLAAVDSDSSSAACTPAEEVDQQAFSAHHTASMHVSPIDMASMHVSPVDTACMYVSPIESGEGSSDGATESVRATLQRRLGHLLDFFTDWDKTGSGTVSKGALLEVLPSLGLTLTQRDLDELFDTFDDGSGTIEYLTFYKQIRKRLASPRLASACARSNLGPHGRASSSAPLPKAHSEPHAVGCTLPVCRRIHNGAASLQSSPLCEDGRWPFPVRHQHGRRHRPAPLMPRTPSAPVPLAPSASAASAAPPLSFSLREKIAQQAREIAELVRRARYAEARVEHLNRVLAEQDGASTASSLRAKIDQQTDEIISLRSKLRWATHLVKSAPEQASKSRVPRAAGATSPRSSVLRGTIAQQAEEIRELKAKLKAESLNASRRQSEHKARERLLQQAWVAAQENYVREADRQLSELHTENCELRRALLSLEQRATHVEMRDTTLEQRATHVGTRDTMPCQPLSWQQLVYDNGEVPCIPNGIPQQRA